MALLKRAWTWLERFASDPRKILIADTALFLALVGLAIGFWSYASQTHTALCSLRAVNERQVERSEAFLAEHPNLQSFRFGPVLVTRKQLVAQVEMQRAQLRSLDDNLSC